MDAVFIATYESAKPTPLRLVLPFDLPEDAFAMADRVARESETVKSVAVMVGPIRETWSVSANNHADFVCAYACTHPSPRENTFSVTTSPMFQPEIGWASCSTSFYNTSTEALDHFNRAKAMYDRAELNLAVLSVHTGCSVDATGPSTVQSIPGEIRIRDLKRCGSP